VSRQRFFQAALESRTAGTIRIGIQLSGASALGFRAGLAQQVELLRCSSGASSKLRLEAAPLKRLELISRFTVAFHWTPLPA
jgi:hypothetical protein